MLGSRIAALRRSADMSQSALAELLGISQSAVGMYEQGRREPSADILVALSTIFDVTVDYLLTGRPRSGPDLIAASAMLLHNQIASNSEQKMQSCPFSHSDLAILLAASLMSEKSQ